MQSHFWVGSFCRILKRTFFGRQVLSFPSVVVSVSDNIRIIRDLGNNIPDKSWMLYLLELFDDSSRQIPIELNLICQFNDRDNFWAIFGGVNRYKFTEVVPVVGHAYQRSIALRREKNTIDYQVTDLSEGTTEQFEFQQSSENGTSPLTSFQASNNFTGLEWWNKSGNSLFSIRYEVLVSNLMYGLYSNCHDTKSSSTEMASFSPFYGFVANQDGYALEYPVTFADVGLDSEGCTKYLLTTGACKSGLDFVPR